VSPTTHHTLSHTGFVDVILLFVQLGEPDTEEVSLLLTYNSCSRPIRQLTSACSISFLSLFLRATRLWQSQRSYSSAILSTFFCVCTLSGCTCSSRYQWRTLPTPICFGCPQRLALGIVGGAMLQKKKEIQSERRVVVPFGACDSSCGRHTANQHRLVLAL
jgi:hypothetical protein